MNIKLELISNAITDLVMQKLDVINIDADKIADTTAINALSEIQYLFISRKFHPRYYQ